MFNKLSYFVNFNESLRTILLENDFQITAKGIRTVKIKLPYLQLKIKDMLYCPKLSNCLLSMGSRVKNHYPLQPGNKKEFIIINQLNQTLLDGDCSSGTLIIKQAQQHLTRSVHSSSN
ncbi:hypothetical protein O181_005836 [Austropuccinia psidii MF-1]|uniref:Retrovirus-related Pol polyprotein from transposon TNT 1-94-like beta-barrel domain-containing protein n=1 Tax=Austropuccinia psidii MF-1 TaxID=1389203 RepID=A0A9Q3GG83_9BASI|nr:hypothetical protein [Austropuccinia psidii MF-1]